MDPLLELEQQVEKTAGVINSAIALLAGLKKQLDSAGTDKVKLMALSKSLSDHERSLADALVVNSLPTDPVPPPVNPVDPNAPHIEHHRAKK